MFEHTVVAAHFASASAPLFQSLEELRERGTQEITLVDVLQHVSNAYYPNMDPADTEKTEARQRLEEEQQELERAGFKVNTELRIGQPAHELCMIARKTKASLILVGSRGESAFREFLRGSTVLQLIRKTVTPVLIEPIDPGSRQITGRGLSDILFATDFSKSAQEAESVAIGLAKKAKRMILMHVVEHDEREQYGEEHAMERARQLLEELAGRMPIQPENLKLDISRGSASSHIHRLAREEGSSLVIIGKRGHSPIPELLLGSTAQSVVKGATQSILMVPPRLAGF